MLRHFFLLSGLMMLTLGCGCDSHTSWQARTVPVTGRITINGEIPAGASVQFLPLDKRIDSRGSCPFGVVADDGTFTLMTYKPNDGCPIGEFAVVISWPPAPESPADRLDGVYSTKENPLAVVNVTSSTRKLEPIDVTGVAVKSSGR